MGDNLLTPSLLRTKFINYNNTRFAAFFQALDKAVAARWIWPIEAARGAGLSRTLGEWWRTSALIKHTLYLSIKKPVSKTTSRNRFADATTIDCFVSLYEQLQQQTVPSGFAVTTFLDPAETIKGTRRGTEDAFSQLYHRVSTLMRGRIWAIIIDQANHMTELAWQELIDLRYSPFNGHLALIPCFQTTPDRPYAEATQLIRDTLPDPTHLMSRHGFATMTEDEFQKEAFQTLLARIGIDLIDNEVLEVMTALGTKLWPMMQGNWHAMMGLDQRIDHAIWQSGKGRLTRAVMLEVLRGYEIDDSGL